MEIVGNAFQDSQDPKAFEGWPVESTLSIEEFFAQGKVLPRPVFHFHYLHDLEPIFWMALFQTISTVSSVDAEKLDRQMLETFQRQVVQTYFSNTRESFAGRLGLLRSVCGMMFSKDFFRYWKKGWEGPAGTVVIVAIFQCRALFRKAYAELYAKEQTQHCGGNHRRPDRWKDVDFPTSLYIGFGQKLGVALSRIRGESTDTRSIASVLADRDAHTSEQDNDGRADDSQLCFGSWR